ncbi:TIGR01777 family oxidoreductase [Neptuniibacter sp. 2_MG-2023]|uniref:TIGR01777 family oxidoreductase n=1 Tax=Neptuniibacter sp. 2_MG-2023 TaxID=3062671 RepID=UPI0026E45306|nr:TIGR01777 family oxidoreductase [Neptuniibacter sp. 2_MG-2023]MDO6513494.1 TIGR01777 family oxidoreductase [Neptuniibacter sp. 2_MG-2023]
MKILITGGTGFIGQHFIRRRLAVNDEIYCLTRDQERAQHLFKGTVEVISALSELEGISLDAVINLAGEPILDKRWSTERKELLYSSRVELTNDLVKWLAQLSVKPKVLISGSAIGYYGSQLDEELGEASPCRSGFTHHLCLAWENAALQAERLGIRVCLLRTGIVLGEGGALAKMEMPFKLGLGGAIGDGKQWMSWIHIDDQIEIIEMLLTHEQFSGAFNLTAPETVTNKEFSSTLGHVLHRPTVLPMPVCILKLILGEGAELLAEGQRVVPKNLLDSGYKFNYPKLEQALASIYRN